MAFIPTLPLRHHTRHKSHHTHRRARRCTTPHASYPSHHPLHDYVPPHPYGNGGLDNRIDFTGYSPDRLAEEIEDAKRRMAEAPEERVSNWVIVMSADILQWNNNLFKASVEEGFNWDLTGIHVIPLAETTMRRVLDELDGVWIVLKNDGQLLTITQKGQHVAMTFEHGDEAIRFVDHLHARGDDARMEKIGIDRIERICVNAKAFCGLVPKGTLVTPGKL